MKVDHRGYVLLGELAPCDCCGKLVDINLLDAKPAGPPHDKWSDQVLECEACYGPGWCPAETLATERKETPAR